MISRNFLVVGFTFNPVARGQTSEQKLPAFIIDKDDEGEWQGRQPPVDLQGVHPKTLVHARSVGQESGQSSLEEETKVEDPVGHALLEDRELASLTNDEISPLDDDNGDKEGSVASVLKDLSVPVGPLLAVGIFQVIDSN